MYFAIKNDHQKNMVIVTKRHTITYKVGILEPRGVSQMSDMVTLCIVYGVTASTQVSAGCVTLQPRACGILQHPSA